MKKLALILALTAAPAHAGGPVIIEDTAETVAPNENDDKVPAWVLVVLGIAVVAAISGNSDNCFAPEEPTPGPCD